MRAVFDAIIDIVPSLSKESLGYLFSKVKEIPLKEYDEKILTFLKEYTVLAMNCRYMQRNEERASKEREDEEGFGSGHHAFEDAEEEEQDRKDLALLASIGSIIKGSEEAALKKLCEDEAFGVPILWDLMQDGMQYNIALVGKAMSALEDLLKLESCRHLRAAYLARCMQNLASGNSVTQSLNLSAAIVETYPQQRVMRTISISDIIQVIDKELNLVDLIVDDLSKYHLMVKEKLKSIAEKGKSIEKERTHVFIGAYSHEENLDKRL